jgi:hypothetical protein
MAAINAPAKTFQFSDRNNPKTDRCALYDKIIIMLDRLPRRECRPSSTLHFVPWWKCLKYTLDMVLSSFRKAIGSSAELNPGNSAYHYNLGLFFKTRGKFEEGIKSNQTRPQQVW